MKSSIITCILILKFINCHDSKSTEVNGVEVTPFYDTIIFNDIADIFNEFDNNVNSPIDVFEKSDSESEENIENLLSEYQSYLERAHKQRRDYMEKMGNKNKVPLLRHEKYFKTYPTNLRHGNYYDLFNPSSTKLLQNSNNPFDLLIPLNMKAKQFSNTELGSYQNKLTKDELVNIDKTFYNDKKVVNLSPNVLDLRRETVKTSCFCKTGQIPCKCNCKQCLIPLEPFSLNYNKQNLFDSDIEIIENPTSLRQLKRTEYASDTSLNDSLDNIFNIRIKVDVQLPKTQDGLRKYFKYLIREKTLERDKGGTKEYRSVINLPMSYFNFPIPLDLFGYKKTINLNKRDPIHQLTIAKKKKSRPSSNSKKHRKKIISFHDIKITSPLPLNGIEENNTTNNDNIMEQYINKTENVHMNNTDTNRNNVSVVVAAANNTNQFTRKNDTHLEESIYFLVNISNNNINTRDDFHKMGNSIEGDYAKINPLNITTERMMISREKREIANSTVVNKNDTILKLNITQVKSKPNKKEKSVIIDSDLLYWPNVPKNKSIESSKNITEMILEREYKKGKLNMSTETIRHNHTRVLEQAIFGQVNWDDVDTVVPTFISFVGKYIRGALTFCSPSTCHSMRCAEKICVHRVCLPEERLNQRGHCVGSNTTDSVASMESIMDLPSNIAFEIVDILQDKMLGKIFGKVTLCISTKCISFIAVKKTFLKSKCILKELNKMGHCPYNKNVKSM